MIDVIETEEGFDSLKNEWESINKSSDQRIQQTYIWNRLNWSSVADQGKRLFLMKWTQDGKPEIVIFPFYIDGNGVLRIINDLHNDHCDSVHSNAKFNRYFAYREAVDTILSERRIKGVWMQKLSGDSELLHYFSVFLPGALTARDNSYAWVELDGSGDFAKSQLHFRSDHRKHLRKLYRQSSECTFRVLSVSGGDAFPEKEISLLRDAMINKGVRANNFLPDSQVDFVKKMYYDGMCEIPLLEKGDDPVALNIHFLYRGNILAWIFLGKAENYGTEIDVRYCVDFAARQKGILDLGVGTYEYKLLTFRPNVAVTFCLRMGKDWLTHFKQAFAMNLRFLKNYIKDWRQRRR